MNAGQLNVDLETGGETIIDNPPSKHPYNL